MAGRVVDALANMVGLGWSLNDGPTLLGEGAFGKVFKETRNVNNTSQVCAVKKISNFDKKEVKEVETLMNLDHKRIIKCYGHHFEDNGRTLCIVMEFADKGTFTKVIKEEAQDPGSNRFKEYSIWRFLWQLSRALDYLHTLPQPILHRDLKPDNILGVREHGGITWKLADFGLVKLLGENAQGDFYAQTICGTPTYMAPEVWDSYKGYTFSADIWSLGCIIAFRCNRGKHLFQGTRSIPEMMQKMREWKGLPHGAIRGYSSDLVNLIGRMLHPDHHRRPTAREINAECTLDRQAKK